MTKLQYPGRPTKTILNGKKVCRGPFHPEGGAWVPLSDYHFHKSGSRKGQPFSQCRNCVNYRKLKNPTGQHGYIEIDILMPYIEALRKRLGIMEAYRRMGVTPNFTQRMRKNRYVRKATAQRILIAFKEMNENRESRHPKSIHRGAALRGEKERKPPTRYRP